MTDHKIKSPAELQADWEAWYEQRYGLNYIAKIEKLVNERLAAANPPIKPMRTQNGGYVSGLARVAELQRHSRRSQAWHDANILDAIGHMRATLKARKRNAAWIEQVVHAAMEVGIAKGMAGVTIDGLARARTAAAAANSRKAKQRHSEFVEMAMSMREKNHALRPSRCAALIAEKTGENERSIRRAIARLWG